MKSYIKWFRNLMILGLAIFITGFCVVASSPENVFIGISIIGISTLLYIVAIVVGVKSNIAKEKEKEDRVKKLEDEITEIKSKLNHKL